MLLSRRSTLEIWNLSVFPSLLRYLGEEKERMEDRVRNSKKDRWFLNSLDLSHNCSSALRLSFSSTQLANPFSLLPNKLIEERTKQSLIGFAPGCRNSILTSISMTSSLTGELLSKPLSSLIWPFAIPKMIRTDTSSSFSSIPLCAAPCLRHHRVRQGYFKMDLLPSEIVTSTCGYLSTLELGQLTSVCRGWNGILLNTSSLWRRVELVTGRDSLKIIELFARRSRDTLTSIKSPADLNFTKINQIIGLLDRSKTTISEVDLRLESVLYKPHLPAVEEKEMHAQTAVIIILRPTKTRLAIFNRFQSSKGWISQNSNFLKSRGRLWISHSVRHQSRERVRVVRWRAKMVIRSQKSVCRNIRGYWWSPIIQS